MIITSIYTFYNPYIIYSSAACIYCIEGEAKTGPHTAPANIYSHTYPACAGSCPLPPPHTIRTFSGNPFRLSYFILTNGIYVSSFSCYTRSMHSLIIYYTPFRQSITTVSLLFMNFLLIISYLFLFIIIYILYLLFLLYFLYFIKIKRIIFLYNN